MSRDLVTGISVALMALGACEVHGRSDILDALVAARGITTDALAKAIRVIGVGQAVAVIVDPVSARDLGHLGGLAGELLAVAVFWIADPLASGVIPAGIPALVIDTGCLFADRAGNHVVADIGRRVTEQDEIGTSKSRQCTEDVYLACVDGSIAVRVISGDSREIVPAGQERLSIHVLGLTAVEVIVTDAARIDSQAGRSVHASIARDLALFFIPPPFFSDLG
jgi:hypothetical protein